MAQIRQSAIASGSANRLPSSAALSRIVQILLVVSCCFLVQLVQAKVYYANSNGNVNTGFGIDINTRTGWFKVLVDDKTWLLSGPITLHTQQTWFSSAPHLEVIATKPLQLVNTYRYTGNDAVLGDFNAFRMSWSAQYKNDTTIIDTPYDTIFKIYTRTSAIVFEQYFPLGAQGM